MREDYALAQQALKGDQRAFEVLYHRTNPKLTNTIKHTHPEDYEDLVQSAWGRIWRKLSLYKGDAAFSTWAIRVALNVMYQHIRDVEPKWKILTPLVFEEDGVVCAPEPAFEDERLRDAPLRVEFNKLWQRLPQGKRALWWMRFHLGCEGPEIAEILGISEAAVRSRIFKLKRELKEMALTSQR